LFWDNTVTKDPRSIQPASEAALFKGKAIAIYGPRQVGKTTLVKDILARYPSRAVYLNCDELDVCAALTGRTSTERHALIGSTTLVVVDEAQRVRGIDHAIKWRTYGGSEIDYLEEEGGWIIGFECKWANERWRAPRVFADAYPDSQLHLVNRDNFLDFLT
jgi:hypothetical protein